MDNKSHNKIMTDDLPKAEIAKIENANLSKEEKEKEIITVLRKKRIESMTDEEIIEENLKSILDIESREERKANGRLIAVLVAFLLIFLAVYHAWIRKTAVLAGILVPASIMLGYGGWVVVLAKRDKRRRAMFEKHLAEIALKNKQDLEKKATASKNKSEEARKNPTATVHFENEISKKKRSRNKTKNSGNDAETPTIQIEGRRSRRKGRTKGMALASQMMKEGYGRRSSIAQKLFGQNPDGGCKNSSKDLKTNEVLVHKKRKKLGHIDALPMPQIARMSATP